MHAESWILMVYKILDLYVHDSGTSRLMRLIGLVLTLSLSFSLAPPAAEAQQAAKAYRIGILWYGPESSIPPSFAVFRQSLADAGYIEGTNLSFSHRWSGFGQPVDFPEHAKELVHLKVDLLFATSTSAIHAAADATTTIPIVVISVGDPVGASLITSLARPGRNITGLSARVPDVNAKLLELLKESVPRASKIAVLGGTAVGLYRKEMEGAARTLGVRLQFLELTNPSQELNAAFNAAAKARAEGIVLLPTQFMGGHLRLVAGLALQRRLPSIFWATDFAQAGGLMAYGPDYSYLWRRAGALVGRILNGTTPGDLPVEQADRFRLVINLKTAKALGLTIPQSLLIRADEIIK
jgi:putative ABC transport system substrate-binding protein